MQIWFNSLPGPYINQDHRCLGYATQHCAKFLFYLIYHPGTRHHQRDKGTFSPHLLHPFFNTKRPFSLPPTNPTIGLFFFHHPSCVWIQCCNLPNYLALFCWPFGVMHPLPPLSHCQLKGGIYSYHPPPLFLVEAAYICPSFQAKPLTYNSPSLLFQRNEVFLPTTTLFGIYVDTFLVFKF